MYRISGANIIRLSDGAVIPVNVGNRDYADYLAWVAAGNVPDPEPAPTAAEINAAIDNQIEALERTTMYPRGAREALLLLWDWAMTMTYGITSVQLRDPLHPRYSVGFTRLYDLNAQIIALRAQRLP